MVISDFSKYLEEKDVMRRCHDALISYTLIFYCNCRLLVRYKRL